MMTNGFRYGAEPEQFRNSKFILAWGANVLGTNVHLWPFIVEARRKGAKFYVIDPVKNRTGSAADKHFFVHPGSDLALALGLMHVILGENLHDAEYVEKYTTGFEDLRELASEYPPERVEALTGIGREDIVSLAREYATTKPAIIRVNYGVQRSERGGTAVRAIASLAALTGSWRDAGGGLQLTTSGAFAFNLRGLEMPDLQQKSTLGREARILNMSEIGKVLTAQKDPPVKAMVVYNSNPAAIAPNANLVRQGFLRDDLFIAVLEQFQTDSADFADILLPVTTFLEHTDLYRAYGHYYVQLARPALPAPGECKTNVEIFRLLAKRLGFTDSAFDDSEDDMIRTTLASGHPFLEGITLERLDAEHSVRLNIPTPFLPYAEGGFGTKSGKCELSPEVMGYTPPMESRLGALANPQYPLEMVSAKADETMNSTFGNRNEVDRVTAQVDLHAADAGPRGIYDGDSVRVFNDRGSLVLTARVDGVVAPGTVRVPAVRWAKKAADKFSVNVLTSDRLTDLGDGPTFYNCLVQIEKCGD
jgi:anaerobic selenocysteine-containing dehydrogenase